MTKAELIEEIIALTGKNHELSEKVVAILLSSIAEAVQNDNSVSIVGFGTFYLKWRNPTTGRIITQNKMVLIPGRFVPAFKPYSDFKNQVKAIISIL